MNSISRHSLVATMAVSAYVHNVYILLPKPWEQTASPWWKHSRCILVMHRGCPWVLWMMTQAADAHGEGHSDHEQLHCQSNSYTPVQTVTHLPLGLISVWVKGKNNATHAQSTIMLYTELHTQCDNRQSSSAHIAIGQSLPGAFNIRLPAITIYIALANG